MSDTPRERCLRETIAPLATVLVATELEFSEAEEAFFREGDLLSACPASANDLDA